ncbi:GFA family protein [Candidatus Uabimicrobium sp. HlEnr_7]|uniref:GFA family protein n=1 Tax=Candidatus Uabimicrobium helgolandensis TaxID=3095367 RepID=UPI00355683DE
MSHHGSCLCGGIKFEMSKAPAAVVNCHCSICRDSHGATFATQGIFPAESFSVKEGEDKITEYESSTDFFRVFCKSCGSHVVNYPRNRMFYSVAVNYLEEKIQPEMHIWVGSKAEWYNINDSLPQDEKMDKLMAKLQG